MKNLSFRSRLWQSGLSFLDWLFLHLETSKSKPANQNIKSVLIIRFDALGDFILWLDAAKAIRRIYPDNKFEITLMVNEDFAELAKETPFFDHVWPINRNDLYRNLLYRYRILHQVRKLYFDTVIQTTCSRRFYLHDAIVRFSGAPHKIGVAGDLSNITRRRAQRSDQYYTKLIPLNLKIEHELDKNAELVRGLGMKEFIAAVPVLQGSFPSWKIPSRDYFVLFPGAGWNGRMWPAGWFGEIARRVYQETGWCCVICGGSGEIATAVRISDEQRGFPIYNLAGKTSLSELVGVIQQARLVVANETSAVHLAAAVSTPSVCILGGGHYGRFVPYPRRLRNNKAIPVPVYREMECFGCNWNCIFEVEDRVAVPCIKDISVEAVWEATFEAIKMDKKPC